MSKHLLKHSRYASHNKTSRHTADTKSIQSDEELNEVPYVRDQLVVAALQEAGGHARIEELARFCKQCDAAIRAKLQTMRERGQVTFVPPHTWSLDTEWARERGFYND